MFRGALRAPKKVIDLKENGAILTHSRKVLRGTLNIYFPQKAQTFRGALRAPQSVMNFKENGAILTHSRSMIRATLERYLPQKSQNSSRRTTRAAKYNKFERKQCDFGTLQERSMGHFGKIFAPKKPKIFRGTLRAPPKVINFKENGAILAYSRSVLKGTLNRYLPQKKPKFFAARCARRKKVINFKENGEILTHSRKVLRATLNRYLPQKKSKVFAARCARRQK